MWTLAERVVVARTKKRGEEGQLLRVTVLSGPPMQRILPKCLCDPFPIFRQGTEAG